MRSPRPSYYTVYPGAHPLVKLIFRKINEEQFTLLDLAARSGVDRNTIVSWKKNRNPSLANIEAVLNVIGLKLKVEQIDG